MGRCEYKILSGLFVFIRVAIMTEILALFELVSVLQVF